MNQDIIKSLNLEIAEIIKSKDEPDKKLTALGEVKERMELLLSKETTEQKRLMTVICEVSGNQYVLAKKFAEAEKQYRLMLQYSAQLYKKDQTRFDLLLAQANLRMGVFYKDLLKISAILPRPVTLNEKQKPVYDMCIKLFQNAVQAAINKVKAGNQAAVELQTKAMNHLMMLRAAIGEYQEAEKIGVQLVKVGKALFQVTDDAPHALELAQWMVNLATVYTIQKNFVKAMEMHEDCIYVLEDKEKENPQIFDLRLASEYINLGNVCTAIPEEEKQVPEYYDKGTALFRKLNQDYQNRYEKEEKQICGIVGNYYRKKGQEEKANLYLQKAGL